jgi:hypothetical protein
MPIDRKNAAIPLSVAKHALDKGHGLWLRKIHMARVK